MVGVEGEKHHHDLMESNIFADLIEKAFRQAVS